MFNGSKNESNPSAGFRFSRSRASLRDIHPARIADLNAAPTVEKTAVRWQKQSHPQGSASPAESAIILAIMLDEVRTVGVVLQRYIEIHNDIFRIKWRRLLPLGKSYEAIDISGHMERLMTL